MKREAIPVVSFEPPAWLDQPHWLDSLDFPDGPEPGGIDDLVDQLAGFRQEIENRRQGSETRFYDRIDEYQAAQGVAEILEEFIHNSRVSKVIREIEREARR